MRDRPRPGRRERWDGATYLQVASTWASQDQPEADQFSQMVAQGQLVPRPGIGMETNPSELAIRRPLTENEDAALRSFRNAAIWALKDGRGNEDAVNEILVWGGVLLVRFN